MSRHDASASRRAETWTPNQVDRFWSRFGAGCAQHSAEVPSVSTCAFCGLPGTMTREHLWPAALHQRLLTANSQSQSAFWLRRLEKPIAAEPQIRDVCARCNNGVLSELDAYICELFDRSFIRMPARGDSISFDYDYHRLKRWLLKMSYNSARIHSAPDLEALEKTRKYILGDGDALGRSTAVFLHLTYPERIPPSDVADVPASIAADLFYPAGNRAGYTYFSVEGLGLRFLRSVHLRAFSFSLAYARDEGGRANQSELEELLSSHMPGIVRLRPSRPAVELRCNGMGAWESFKNAYAQIDRGGGGPAP